MVFGGPGFRKGKLLQQPLPIPCSFLLDEQGRTGAIYKAPVALDQLLADVKFLDGAPRSVASVPGIQPLGIQRDKR